MNKKNKFLYLLQKSPLIRFFVIIIFAVVIILLTLMFGVKLKRYPVINTLSPSVGSAGDIMILTGENFGSIRNLNYVEIGGSRITSSGYLQWTDKQIKIVLPADVPDGLVFVCTDTGKSKPKFFANTTDIPVAVPPDPKTFLPLITNISKSEASTGNLITISGNNFGSSRETSQVFFSGEKNYTKFNSQNRNENYYIPALSHDFDYESWSDTEIKVRIPNGASSGTLYVKTKKGTSPTFPIQITNRYGTKYFSDKHTYIVSFSADITDVKAKDNSTVTLRFPFPMTAASQPSVKLTESNPEPDILNYRNTIIHQILLSDISQKKTFHHNFVIEVYKTETKINNRQIRPFSEKTRTLYEKYTTANTHIPSDNKKICTLCNKIIQKEQNPYNQAKLIYTYMVNNFKIKEKIRSGNISPLDLLDKKNGDAYDFAIIYTTLLRAAGIPARPLSGILVEQSLNTRNHWWTEFYLENYGWVPVDSALGAGLQYSPFKKIENPKDFYFGNLDSQHITISYGWNNVQPALQNSKILYRPRTYALQTIWEEASSETKSYSSLWANPVVLGIY